MLIMLICCRVLLLRRSTNVTTNAVKVRRYRNGVQRYATRYVAIRVIRDAYAATPLQRYEATPPPALCLRLLRCCQMPQQHYRRG